MIGMDRDRATRRYRLAGDRHLRARRHRRVPGDPLLVAMHRAVPAYAEARDDYNIFSALAEHLGLAERFTEGRSARQWLRYLYEPTRRALLERGAGLPSSTSSGKRANWHCRPCLGTVGSCGHSATTPWRRPCRRQAARSRSVREDCRVRLRRLRGTSDLAHEAEGPNSRFPLQVVANQPATRLHSQLDFGATSLNQR